MEAALPAGQNKSCALEAHGTGTALGDPVEVDLIVSVNQVTNLRLGGCCHRGFVHKFAVGAMRLLKSQYGSFGGICSCLWTSIPTAGASELHLNLSQRAAESARSFPTPL